MSVDIKKNILILRQRIASAANRSSRNPSDIRIAAATKTVEPERIKDAIAGGINIFGENYVQEAKEKISDLRFQISDSRAKWHFIGTLQKNKVKYAVHLFDMIETVDTALLAVEIDKRAEKKMDILIQVNIGGEKTKSGCCEGDVLNLVKGVAGLKNIAVKGLMTIPPFFEDPEDVRPYFRRLFEISRDVQKEGIEDVSMTELSMGMSNDFETAIEEGATIVRIGTAIFGKRENKKKT
ncbi:MAG: YggS family pyridoxal phosphate-dependent enzyme [Deltaproteobacteria bacterium]|nr:YggS family pyridoxal phosphate-dependent enzyme [Deltaproteobacteria bacterium]